MATSPSSTHQNTHRPTGTLKLPPAVMVATTSEPESDEVTKKMTIRTRATTDSRPVSGRGSSILNSVNSGVQAVTLAVTPV